MVCLKKCRLLSSLGLRQGTLSSNTVQLLQTGLLSRGEGGLYGRPQRLIAQQMHGRQLVSQVRG